MHHFSLREVALIIVHIVATMPLPNFIIEKEIFQDLGALSYVS